jgi:Tfp pilus assembly protein PilE
MIVVLVIGILAAIAMPNFMAMRERAREAGVKANMHTVQLHAEDYGVMHDGVFSDVMDATHIGSSLPQRFANPYDGLQGPGKAYEDRAVFAAPPSATTGIVSYADSATQTYNVKGQVRGSALSLVLSCSQ